MRRPAGAFCALVLALVTGCAVEPREVSLALVAPEALGCRATEVTALRVSPLGDFPTEVRPSVSVDPAGEPVRIDRFPSDTELVRIEAEGYVQLLGGGTAPWLGGGLARVDRDALVVPLLRYGRGCALADPTARVPTGAAALALDDGRLWIAGGEDDAALARIVTVRPGERLAQASSQRLFTPRTRAGAVVLADDVVVVAGGAVASGGAALDTVEAFRVTEGDEASLEGGFLRAARAAPAVARIGPRALLVVGGRDGGGAVADAERLEVDDGVTTTLEGPALPRWGARALPLDDGTILVVGGEDEAGPSAGIERFADDALERLEVSCFAPDPGADDDPTPLDPRADAAWVALPGARAMRLGGRTGDGWSADVELLLDGGRRCVTLADRLVPMEAPVAEALLDGRVLVIGRTPVTGLAVGQVLDPADTRPATAVEPSRVATHLLRLADGTLVEADAEGVSLLRLDAASRFDDPQASLFPAQPEQRAELSLDGPARWSARGDLLVAAVDGARLDVPTARFLRVRVELEVEGEGRLLLDPDGAPAHVIALEADAVRLGSCAAPRTSPVVIERREGAVRIGEVDCDLDEPARVAVGLALDRGAGVRRIAVSRVGP